ncbi:MAG TPA: VPLPA-CTERM sorting domain-containing protein [Gammaproteobacteria bacterium]|nr:VPLPA-CTERM sorting domain-containing protein [Gammaproteobacteria bacterium]
MRNYFTSLRVTAAIALVVYVGESHATVLIFDQSRNATQTTVVPTSAGSVVQQDYGDNVTGSPMNVPGGQFTYGNQGEGFTPNVVVDYFSDTGVGQWTIQYGDLTNVLFAGEPLTGASPNTLNVRLTADLGFEVQLYHFDLAGWANTDYTINGVSVFSNTAMLFSENNVLVEGDSSGPGHTAFDFATPLSAQQLVIEIDFSNILTGSQDNIGIDNIRFGQNPPALIPIPATAWLFGSGLLGLIGISRRKKAA